MNQNESLDKRSTVRYNSDVVRIDEVTGFEWDDGNSGKSFAKHGVTDQEAEEVFLDPNRKLFPDPKHSRDEIRRIVVGKTQADRTLLVVFTIRNKRIRVISARDLNKKKEAELYEEAN